MATRDYLLGAVAFLALLGVMILLYYAAKQQPIGYGTQIAGNATYNNQNSGGSQYMTVPVEISDPSFLPSGTSSFLLTFSNVSLYTNAGAMIKGGGFGPVNLASLQNQSKVISLLSIPYNTVITSAVLSIKSASIMVGDRQYGVAMQQNQIVANASGFVVGGTNALLIDIGSFATPSQTNTSGVKLSYVAKAYAINASGSNYLGESVALASKAAIALTGQNLTVQNATVVAQGNRTIIRVVIQDNSALPISVNRMVVVGPMQFSYNVGKIDNISKIASEAAASAYIAAGIKANASKMINQSGSVSIGSIVSSLFNTSANGNTGNGYSSINSSVYGGALNMGQALANNLASNFTSLEKLAGPLPQSILNGKAPTQAQIANISAKVYSGIQSGLYNSTSTYSSFQTQISTVPFAIQSGGLMTPSWGSYGQGTIIQPGQRYTLNFSGYVSPINTTYLGLVPNSTYRILVTGTANNYAAYTLNST